MQMNKQIALFVVYFIVGISSVHGHTGATGIVKERMDAMKDMGDRSKIVADMYKGKSEFEQSALAEAADAFALHGSNMVEQFPDTKASRSGSKTEALPKIWEEWEDFNELVIDFIASSEQLQNTVASTDDPLQLKKAFFQTTKSCSGCHKRFRKPKQ